MTALPYLLDSILLPEAELHAARLDGEVYTVDECFAPVDEPDRPWLRAHALATRYPGRVFVGASALWVHGAFSLPPATHHCLQHRITKRSPRDGRLYVHEGALPAHETVTIAGLDVAHPLRTAIDVARSGRRGASTVARLLAVAHVDPAECLAWLRRNPRVSGARAARELFERLSRVSPR